MKGGSPAGKSKPLFRRSKKMRETQYARNAAVQAERAEMYRKAVQKGSTGLEIVPWKYRTYDVCMEAVKKDRGVLQVLVPAALRDAIARTLSASKAEVV
jgi:hypothetical protein